MRASIQLCALLAATCLTAASCADGAHPAPARPAGASGDADPAPATDSASFSVVLTDIGKRKIEVIKAVRAATGLGLKDAKDLVDGAPSTLKTGLPQEEATRLAAALEAAGATSEIRPDAD